ncbi:MAG: winged helix DNA-binding protein [Euryarchaeota archaeon]|jgi:predicted transcriptional regulator|nr:winged helix DNA-binding protein [Euryarchaeota archaeon]
MNAPTNTPTHRTLTVRVASPSDAFEDLTERFEALDRGEEIDPLYRVTFQREEDLQRLLSAKNIQLLRTIARESPDSIRALARGVGRDIRQVHDNLSELEAYGLVEIEDDGRAKRPSVWYDDIEINVPIAAG